MVKYDEFVNKIKNLPSFRYFNIILDNNNESKYKHDIISINSRDNIEANHIFSVENDNNQANNAKIEHNIQIKANPDIINILTNDIISKAKQNNCKFVKVNNEDDQIIISCEHNFDSNILMSENKRIMDGLILDEMKNLSIKATELVKKINSKEYKNLEIGESFF